MIAIPGMNPGNIVAGGGGDAGGGGAGSGKKGKGKAGASTGDGEEDADQGGKGAGPCGNGSGGACTNCASNAAAGDPVNVVTGEVFTEPRADFSLPGLIELRFTRGYSSSRVQRDAGLGWGWGHAMAWSLTVERRVIRVTCPFGAVSTFDRKQAERGAFGDGGFTLVRRPDGYLLDTNDEFMVHFAEIGDDVYRVDEIQHKNGNGFLLSYRRDGGLESLLDTVDRQIVVLPAPAGRIGGFQVTEPATGRTLVLARYGFDEAGNLVWSQDGDGYTTTYAYDERHRLTSYSRPDSLTFFFRYDDRDRCVETWGNYPDGVIAGLDPDAPAVLTDGTPAKGIYHTRLLFEAGYSEVVDSMRFQRFESDLETGTITKAVGTDGGVTTRELDIVGNMVAHTNAEGATTRYKWDVRGRLLEEMDALGRTFRVMRDQDGRVVGNVDFDGGNVACERDDRGNVVWIRDQAGRITTYQIDDRNLITLRTDPDGSHTRFEADALGNLTRMITPTGAVWEWTRDYFGRLVRRADPLGREERFVWSDAGRLLQWHQPAGVSIYYSHDAQGRTSSITGPLGTEKTLWGGLDWPLAIEYPNGDRVGLLYNREGWQTKTIDENGEVAVWSLSPESYVTREVLFDGSTLDVEYDLLGAYRTWTDSLDQATTFERDVVGRLTGFEWGDGKRDAFLLDAKDRDQVATTADTECRFERDALGNVVREQQTVGGEAFVVAYAYDAKRRLAALESSLGHRRRWERDGSGASVAVHLDERTRVPLARDLRGAPVARLLPGGAAIVSEWDERARLRRRSVQPLRAGVPGEPEWVSAGAPLTEKRFEYTPGDELVRQLDSERGVIEYQYDGRQRLVARLVNSQPEEAFRWDPASNHMEVDASGQTHRTYSRGNRLVARKGVRYVTDTAGRLAEKHVPTPSGVDVWRYEWGASGRLEGVALPDRRRVKLVHDAYGRLLLRELQDAEGALLSSTRFVWSLSTLLHEIERKPGQPTQVRSFAYDDNVHYPWAHGDATLVEGATPTHEWFYYVTDHAGTPQELVTGAGLLACRLERTAYSLQVAESPRTTTAARFAGQLEDPHTGLYYNRFRYYDPDTGRYVSADPVGLDAAFNVFKYTPNPVSWVDPLGLDIHYSATKLRTGKGTFVPDGASTADGRRGPGFRSKQGAEIPGTRKLDDGTTTPPPGQTSLNRNSSNAHSEQNALEWAETNFAEDELKGSQMDLGGEYPPCPRCHKAMQEFAARNKSTVEYSWPVNNKVKYDGTNAGKDCKRAPATGSGTHGEKLAGNYNALEAQGKEFGSNKLGGEQGKSTDPEVRQAYKDAFNEQAAEGSLGSERTVEYQDKDGTLKKKKQSGHKQEGAQAKKPKTK